MIIRLQVSFVKFQRRFSREITQRFLIEQKKVKHGSKRWLSCYGTISGMTHHLFRRDFKHFLAYPNLHIARPLRRFGLPASLFLLFSSAGAAVFGKPLPASLAITDLGTLGGSLSMGYGVNNNGEVVGMTLTTGDKAIRGFFYTHGKMTDLGTLGGHDSKANAVNDAGQVTGYAGIKTKGKHHAFLWQRGQMSDLGTSRADDSEGLAISSSGRVVGRITRSAFLSSRACLWQDGKVDTLDDSGTVGSDCTAINSSGQIAGSAREPARPAKGQSSNVVFYSDHAVLWQSGKTSGIGDPDTATSLAYAINDSGRIAGTTSFGKDVPLHACFWQNGTTTNLGTWGISIQSFMPSIAKGRWSAARTRMTFMRKTSGCGTKISRKWLSALRATG